MFRELFMAADEFVSRESGLLAAIEEPAAAPKNDSRLDETSRPIRVAIESLGRRVGSGPVSIIRTLTCAPRAQG
jgi:hypothetical protein